MTATSQNQLQDLNNDYVYDAAGNLYTIPSIASYSYDAENRLVTTAGLNYLYDGDGRRVAKKNGSTVNKIYWYGQNGEVLDETDGTGSVSNSAFNEYIFFGGQRVARRDSSNNVNYYFADHLGTARVVANSSGTILDDSDFYPFGGERVVVSSSGNNYKFTGKERDSESGLDNFGARYYSFAISRFISTDPKTFNGTTLGNPQRWNRYIYVLDNPLTLVDPDGRDAKEFWKAVSNLVSIKISKGAGVEVSGSIAGLKVSASSSSKTETKYFPFSDDKRTETKTSTETGLKGKIGPFTGELKNRIPTVDPATGKVDRSGGEISGSVGVSGDKGETAKGSASVGVSSDHEISVIGVSGGVGPVLGGFEVVVNTEELATAVSNVPSALKEGLTDAVNGLQLWILNGMFPGAGQPLPPTPPKEKTD